MIEFVLYDWDERYFPYHEYLHEVFIRLQNDGYVINKAMSIPEPYEDSYLQRAWVMFETDDELLMYTLALKR